MSHHLAMLERNKIVRIEKSNGRTRYYPSAGPSEQSRNELFMKHWEYRDLRLRVYLTVRRVGTAKPSVVARALGISRQLAGYHLARLLELGMVVCVEGRYRVSA